MNNDNNSMMSKLKEAKEKQTNAEQHIIGFIDWLRQKSQCIVATATDAQLCGLVNRHI